MNCTSLCLFMAIKFVYFVLCHLGWGRVWTWVYDPPVTFTITDYTLRSYRAGGLVTLGIPQNRWWKVVTLAWRYWKKPWNTCQDSQFPDQDLNPELPRYEDRSPNHSIAKFSEKTLFYTLYPYSLIFFIL
jgi:hypothetical protein